MEDQKNKYQSIEEYISQFPAEIQEILKKIQQVIKEAAPQAKEKISYQMPTFYLLIKEIVKFRVAENLKKAKV
jgi:uncharacterized protein YdhG (YjbR/CyaY superfamily)